MVAIESLPSARADASGAPARPGGQGGMSRAETLSAMSEASDLAVARFEGKAASAVELVAPGTLALHDGLDVPEPSGARIARTGRGCDAERRPCR